VSTTANLNLVLPADAAVPAEFLSSLNDRMRQIQTAFKTLSTPASSTGTCLQGTHAARLAQDATSLTPGTQFWETDRFSIYIVRAIGKSGTWAWEAGFYASASANIPSDLGKADNGFVFYATDQETLYVFNGTSSTWASFSTTITSGPLSGVPSGLTGKDAGLLYHVTTGTGGAAYNHTFEWSGTAWTVAERERLGGYFADYAKVPTEPGWQACDGSATHYLDIVAGAITEVAFTVPDMRGFVYRKGAIAYTGTVTAAGTILLGGDTGETSAGTPAGVVALTGATGEASAGVPFGVATTSATPGASTTTILQGTGTGVTVPTAIHTHPATFAGAAMPNHDHDLSGAGATFAGTAMPNHQHDLSAATATFTHDLVANLGVLAYFRR